MAKNDLLILCNGQAADLSACPVLPMARFRRAILDSVASGARLSALFAQPVAEAKAVRLMAVLARPESGDLALLSCEVKIRTPR